MMHSTSIFTLSELEHGFCFIAFGWIPYLDWYWLLTHLLCISADLISYQPLVSYTIKIMYCASNLKSYLFSPNSLYAWAVPSWTPNWYYAHWPGKRFKVHSPSRLRTSRFTILATFTNPLVRVPPLPTVFIFWTLNLKMKIHYATQGAVICQAIEQWNEYQPIIGWRVSWSPPNNGR
jgi:hypothetical protein